MRTRLARGTASRVPCPPTNVGCMDWVRLRQVEIDCILGILPHERRAPQRVHIDLDVGLELEAAAAGDLRQTVDYSALLEEVRFLMQAGAWGLMESAAIAILRSVLLPSPVGRPSALLARIAIAKPDVLQGTIPSVELERAAGWFQPVRVPIGEGLAMVRLLRTAESDAFILTLAPRAVWEPPQSIELFVRSGTLRQASRVVSTGSTLGAGAVAATDEGSAEVLAVTTYP